MSSLTKFNRLLGEAAAAAKAAREIAEKADAEGREMTADERAEFDAKFEEATKRKADADTAKKDADVLEQAKSLAELVGEPEHKDDLDSMLRGEQGDPRRRAKTLGQQVVESPEFKALMRSFPGGRIPEKSRVQSDPIGVKALITGGSDTSGGAFVVPEQTGIVEMLGRRTLAIRSVVSVRRTGSDAVEFVRQTGHTNAAAPVPEATSSAPIDGTTVTNAAGGLKPEGSWSFERDTAVVKTIAEWVPATKRALSDVSALEGLINDELEADLAEAEETQLVSGNGTGENLEGILTVSGTQAQAWDTDLFTTTRRAVSKVRLNGRAIPNGIGLNPADVETIDLARTNEGGANTGSFLGGGPFAMGPRTLWGLPIVESEAIPAGQGIVADWSKAVLWDREQASVTVSDSHADFFTRNLVAILGEERVAFAVVRPSAFVIADLTAL